MVDKFFDKKTSGSGMKNDNMLDQQLAEELQKSIVRTVKKRSAITFYRQYLGC